MPLALSLCSKIQVYEVKKEWIGLFKVLCIADTDITDNIGTSTITFWNTYVKSYYSYIDKNNISYQETTTDLVENVTDTPANKEISRILNYPESQKSCQCRWPWKSYFISNFINKATDIFISHKKWANYKLALKLRYRRIIIIFGDNFKRSDSIEIEFLLAHSILQSLQYDSNKNTGINLLKSRLVHNIKGKVSNKLYKKFCLMIQGDNDIKKRIF